jgi:hypothetical protein
VCTCIARQQPQDALLVPAGADLAQTAHEALCLALTDCAVLLCPVAVAPRLRAGAVCLLLNCQTPPTSSAQLLQVGAPQLAHTHKVTRQHHSNAPARVSFRALQKKWEQTEDKPAAVAVTGGALLLLITASSVVDTIVSAACLVWLATCRLAALLCRHAVACCVVVEMSTVGSTVCTTQCCQYIYCYNMPERVCVRAACHHPEGQDPHHQRPD